MRSLKVFLLYGAFFTLAIGLLSPFFTTGFIYDDHWQRHIPEELRRSGMTVFDLIVDRYQWWAGNGRFFPIVIFWNSILWAHLPDAVSYRLIQMSWVGVDLVLFFALIRALGGSHRLAVLSGIMVLGCVQLRHYHDPIVSYAAIFQISLALGFSVLIAYLKGYFKLSWVIYAAALCFYEIGIVYFLVLTGLIWLHSRKSSRLRTWLPYFGVTLLYFMVTLYLRSQSSLGYEGVRLSVSWKIFATYLWQTTAALPLMYPIFGRTPFYQVGVLTGPFVISAATAALWVLSVGFILGVVRSFGYRVLELPTHRKLSWIGWVLFLSPGITIAITEKYQREIHRPGHAYLPVYLSYFGVALLLAMMMDFKLKAGREKGMAVVIGLILVLNFSLNHAGAEWLNQYWKYPRDQLEESIKQGFFDSARDGDWIVANQQPDWETNEFFDLVAKRKIRLGLLSNYFKLHEGPLPERLSYLHYLGDRHLRILALSPIAGENLKPMGTVRILIYDDRFPRRLVLKSPQFQVELETTGLWTTHLLSPTQFGLDWRDLRLSLM